MNNIEAIADFLCNGLEHCQSTQEAIDHLKVEFKVSEGVANNLVCGYLKQFSAKPIVLNDEIFPFIKQHLK